MYTVALEGQDQGQHSRYSAIRMSQRVHFVGSRLDEGGATVASTVQCYVMCELVICD